MPRRSVADAIRLDQSLRLARNFYVIASVFAVPGAFLSASWLFRDIAALFSPSANPAGALWDIIIDVLIIAFTYVVVSQAFEAGRRIRLLVEDPSADVRPLYVPRILRDY